MIRKENRNHFPVFRDAHLGNLRKSPGCQKTLAEQCRSLRSIFKRLVLQVLVWGQCLGV